MILFLCVPCAFMLHITVYLHKYSRRLNQIYIQKKSLVDVSEICHTSIIRRCITIGFRSVVDDCLNRRRPIIVRYRSLIGTWTPMLRTDIERLIIDESDRLRNRKILTPGYLSDQLPDDTWESRPSHDYHGCPTCNQSKNSSQVHRKPNRRTM